MPPPINPERRWFPASELREFVYCERAWFLSRSVVQQTASARARMDSGTVYHEQCTVAAQQACGPRLIRWGVALLAIVVIGLLNLWVLS